MEFDRVVREEATGATIIDTTFISGSGQELTLGGQFTTYSGSMVWNSQLNIFLC